MAALREIMPVSRISRIENCLTMPTLAGIGMALYLVGLATNAVALSISPTLLTGASHEGSVRIIVGVNAPCIAEGLLEEGAVQQQRAAIATAQEAAMAAMSTGTYHINRLYETIPFVAMTVSVEAFDELRGSPWVTSLVEDVPSRLSLRESAPLVGAPQAWAAGYTGAGQAVAILDTGVDADHPFLAGKVVAEACFSSSASCPNGETTQTGPGSGRPCESVEECPHGTEVAGVAAGKGASFSGIARDASIVAVQITSLMSGDLCGRDHDPCLVIFNSDALMGFEYVYSLREIHSIAAVNASFRFSWFSSQSDCDAADPATKMVVDNLRSVGIATVAGSGNDRELRAIGWPACLSGAVSVGGTNKQDSIYSLSNSALFLSLLAPGVAIKTSSPGGGFESVTGTSFATPHVSGAFAVLKQAASAASVTTLLDALQMAGQPVADYRNGVVTPRLNVYQAIQVLSAPPGSCFTREIPRPSGATTSRGSVCPGDCNGNGKVTVSELVTGVRIDLGATPIGECMPFDRDGDQRVGIVELVAGVNAALTGCQVFPSDIGLQARRAFLQERAGPATTALLIPEPGGRVFFNFEWAASGSTSPAELHLRQRALLDGEVVCDCSVVAHVGSSYVATCIDAWDATLGPHMLRWELDYRNDIEEANEDDNSASAAWETVKTGP